MGLDKSYWAEALTYERHLLNRLPTTVIGGKTPLDVWSGRAARDHGSYGYLVIQPTLMSRKTCWTLVRIRWCFGIQERLERLQVMGF